MKLILSIILILVVVAALAVLVTYIFQRKLLYPAPKGPLPITVPDGVERHEFDAGYALYLAPSPIPQAPVPAIIFAHGNGEWAVNWVEDFSRLSQAGLAVLLVEYPGYAGAAGKPTLDSLRQLMLDAYAFLETKSEVDNARIIPYGRSIGGGPAGLLAAAKPVSALVLESTFTTLAQLVGELRYPQRFLKDRYDTRKVVEGLDVPVFIYHGRQDELIGVHHGEALDEAAAISELVLRDCDHNNCARPWKELLEFLARHKIFTSPGAI